VVQESVLYDNGGLPERLELDCARRLVLTIGENGEIDGLTEREQQFLSERRRTR
jgi:hypothetical protein